MQKLEPNADDNFQSDGVITLSQVHAVHDTYTGFLPSLLPVIKQNLQISNSETGALSLILQAPSLIQPIIGYLADKTSLRYLIILTPAITGVLMSLLGIASSYAMIAFLLIIVGFSSASLHAVGPALAGKLSGKKLGRGMSFWMVGGELGRTLGPVIIVTVIHYLSIEVTPYLMVFGIITTIFLFFKLNGNVSYLKVVNASTQSWQSALKNMLPIFLPLSGIMAARSLLQISISTFLPLFLTEQGNNLWFAGASLTILEAAGVAGAFVSGTLSDRIGRRTMILASLLLSPLFLFLFIFTHGIIQIAATILLGFTALSVSPVLMALVQDNNYNNRAMANGLFSALNILIRMSAVAIIGFMGDSRGLLFAFIVSGSTALLGVPFLFFISDRKR